MARKTKEEALETRNQILDSAERVFSEKGVAQTSLADIAAAAGVTRGAIYWHFKNKADVFTAMVDRVRLPMESMLFAASEDPSHPDPLGSLRSASITILKDTVHNPQRRCVMDVLFHKCEFSAEMGPVMQRQQEAFADGSRHVRRVLQRAVELGQLPADLNIQRADILLYSFLCGQMHQWLFDPERYDLSQEAEAVVNSYIEMLRLCPTLRRP